MDYASVIFRLNQDSVVRLSKSLALKGGTGILPSEAKVMEHVVANTNVLCPRVHRVFQASDPESLYETRGYIVMDYIAGESLDRCWNRLQPKRQDALALQVAGIIEQLQSVNLSIPGPFGGGICTGQVFTDYGDGPFDSSVEMTKWINSKLQFCKYWKKLPSDTPDFDFTTVILTHQDISPRNFVLDRNDRLWLIDWGDAGAYPPCFEVAALRLQVHFQDFSEKIIPHLKFDKCTVERLLSVGPFMLAGKFNNAPNDMF